MNDELIKRAGEVVAQNTGEQSFCVLATVDETGYPKAVTLSVARADGIRTITFGTGLASGKVQRIRGNNRASVCFCSGTYNISLIGTIDVLTDDASKKENWYDGMSHHFSGPDDPGFCVLRFTTERYDLLVDWQTDSGTL